MAGCGSSSSRIGGAVIVVLGVVSIVFLLIHLIPGDPVDVMLGEGATAADREALRRSLGLDLPVAAHAVENLLPALEATDGVTNMDLDSPLLGLAQDLLEVESVLNAHIQMLGEPVEQAENAGFKTLPPHEQLVHLPSFQQHFS